MVTLSKEKLVKSLIDDGYLKTPSIIEAFQTIDRADFVRDEYKNEAYANYPLPIGYGQTISQPLTVAFMLELLEPKSGEKILDIGCGSGWQTAILAQIVGERGRVVGIERIPALKNFAEANISKYPGLICTNGGTNNTGGNETKNCRVKLVLGDGSRGFAENAPYDKIIAAASAREIPQAWKEQLKIGGRLVAPVGESIVLLVKESQDKFVKKQYFGFSFVPLVEEK